MVLANLRSYNKINYLLFTQLFAIYKKLLHIKVIMACVCKLIVIIKDVSNLCQL